MIRFSAALVAVAIAVLIGGIASSKLLLVYIAIAVSAAALVALAIGVLLKRDELFGEGQGLAPAQAGASPELPARTADSDDRGRSNGLVTSPPLPGAATVGPDAAYAAPGHATPAWQAPAASGPVAARRDAPSAAGGATGTGRPARRNGGTASLSQGKPAPSVFASRNAETTAAAPETPVWETSEPENQVQNWFSPAAKVTRTEEPPTVPVASPAAPAEPPTVSVEPKTMPAEPPTVSVEPKTAPAEPPTVPVEPKTAPAPTVGEGGGWDAVPSGENDAWPARYSWLDDEPDEPAEDDGISDDGSAGAVTAYEADAATAPGSEPSATVPSATGAADEAGLVAVVRGVPRFHRDDCVLIRFMHAGDTEKMPVAQAKEAGCTPCAACQPEG